ncbi:unnamed protein product [Rotaria magnacalcarata]|uniref:Uncharacterized protein n=1 Tax=Rotaria magnacalcarata TaxID=392030 RepID=A0A814DJD6_9BILA|nr:unnamed protein product [Rotaria magnacalcarata]CAF3798291.1 unnamed protein product [Rotaria magnacalcarata]CAF3873038.1 unnamed protein product [Rotaria magnacalcarata]CAF3878685.1 unnamed protein product [Rotaria magnacalcarata]CAF3917389.1 unnamed protein product [Rotaria magnacalcarata]
MACNNDAIEYHTSLTSSVNETFYINLNETKQRFYDIKRDPHIEIVNFEAVIERRPTEIDETSLRVLKYKSPSFIATVTFRFPPIHSNECWKVGFVQACDFMLFQNQYGDLGYSSWEFPQLIVRDLSMINDSCGRNFPWYGSKNQVVTIQGPIYRQSEHTITMRDLFIPWIPWDIPTCEGEQSHLTHIYRHQRFYVWLCAMNCTNNELLIIRTIRWIQTIEIDVKPNLYRGIRAKLISNHEPEQPIFLTKNKFIPSCALQAPSVANNAQLLVWRSTTGESTIVVNPKHHDNSTIKYLRLLNI